MSYHERPSSAYRAHLMLNRKGLTGLGFRTSRRAFNRRLSAGAQSRSRSAETEIQAMLDGVPLYVVGSATPLTGHAPTQRPSTC